MESPIEQFVVKTIGNQINFAGINIAFNNSALFMLITMLAIAGFFLYTIRYTHVIPNKLQVLAETLYDFINNMVKENIPGEKGKQFLPFILSIFLFLLFGNIIGLIPYGFSFTSQIVITMSLSVFVLCLTLLYGLYLHGHGIIRVFVPTGIPILLVPFIMVLEIFSFFAKAFSMAVRLFANMMAGHVLLEIVAGFIVLISVFGIIPFGFTVIIYMFELVIAIIQAYVFTILTCIFINQVINVH